MNQTMKCQDEPHAPSECGILPNAEADGYSWGPVKLGHAVTIDAADLGRRLADGSTPEDHRGCGCSEDPTNADLTVLDEAHNAVYGDRGEDYGHPRDHWTRTAIIWTGILQSKLAEGEHISPEDVGRLYIGDKLARDAHQVKRDNRVDIAGYALCLDRLETGQ